MFSFDLKGSNLPDKLKEFISASAFLNHSTYEYSKSSFPTLKIACSRWKEGTVQEIRGPTGGGDGGGREHKKVETQ